ncbi:hypothetical protein [Kribbella sp. NPDC049227]|uniref:hypothetical protein n=1 Tax=Kribbella sp. NPDC049227 TaxID=3364113 RepID=UPI00371B1ACC
MVSTFRLGQANAEKAAELLGYPDAPASGSPEKAGSRVNAMRGDGTGSGLITSPCI